MRSAEFDAVAARVAAGDAGAAAELSLLLQKDLLVVIATYACDRDMVAAVYAETWAVGRAWLAELKQPRAQSQPASGFMLGRQDSALGWPLALRLRERALALLRERLAAADRQSIDNKDALRHLIAQAGMEALPAAAGQLPEVLALVRDKIRLIPPAANGLLAKRYAEGLPLDEIARQQGRTPAEVAAALALARGAVDWQPGGMLVDPGDGDFPVLIEDYIAGTIAYDARLALADSLLSDLSRTAGFVRQLRLDLVLAIYSQSPPAELAPGAGAPASPVRTSSRLPVAAVSSLHPAREGPRQGGSSAARQAKAGGAAAPAKDSSARLWFMLSAALVVLAVIVGVIGLSRPAPAPAARAAPVAVASEPTAAPVRVDNHSEPPPPSAGADSVRIESGLAIVRRSGVRFRLQPPSLVHAGEGIETEADKGPLVLSLRGGRTLTISVNAQTSALAVGSGERDSIQLERGQARVELPAGARGLVVRVGKTSISGDGAAGPEGAAFAVSTLDGGLRLEVGRGLAALETGDARGPGWIFPGQIALIGSGGEVAVESSGAFIAGINLAGPGLEHEGHRWKSLHHALADGLSVASGVASAVTGGRIDDPALKPLLEHALGGDVRLSQVLPNGTYDVVAWLVGAPGAEIGALAIGGDALKKHEPEMLGPGGWRRCWPRRCRVEHGSLELELHGGQLAGLAIFASNVAAALPPSAFLDLPAGDLSVTAPGTLTLSAAAYAPAGGIRTVEFLVDAQKIGEAANPPYTLAWPYQEAGKHRIAVQAVAANGLTAPSPSVSVTVMPAGKPKPVLQLGLADPRAQVTGAAPIVLAVTGEHLEAPIAKVEIRVDGMRLGEAAEAPWHISWSKAPAGEHVLTAIATLAGGGSVASEPVAIVVQAPVHQPPQIAIDSPEDGGEFADGSRLVVHAKASASEGRVAKVEFLADGQKIGESGVAPFSCAWAKAAPGAHQLTAIAIDSSGARGTSEPVLVIVGKNSGFPLVRGICLGGEAIDLEGARWLTQEQALAGGLSLSPGRAVNEALPPVPATDAGTAQMLANGYEASGSELRVVQEAPDGIYQVALWLGEGKVAYAHLCEVEVQGVKAAQPIGRLAKGGWAKYGPFLAKVRDQRLSIVLHARTAAPPRLMGLAIYSSPYNVPPAVVERFPRPLVELTWDAVTGNATPNGGTLTEAANATLTSPWPQRRAGVPPGGTSAGMDFGRDLGNFGIDVLGAGRALRGLKSFTISAWVNPRDLQEGPGGNRLAVWTTGGDGVDFVTHADGSVQLGVNAWDDLGGIARSSPGKLVANEQAPLENWRFVAVSYDSTLEHQQVRYYFGGNGEKVAFDRAEDAPRGAVGMNPCADLGVGNQAPEMRRAGHDRMFRGVLGALRIWGSAADGSGALSQEQLAAAQTASSAAGGIRLPPPRTPAGAPGAPPVALAPPGAQQLLVDDFERDPLGWSYVGGWEFPGAKGAAAREAGGVAHSGNHSYRLDYDFTAGGVYVGVWKTLETVKVPDVKEFRIWVKTDGLTSLGVRLGDGTDQVHQSQVRLNKTPDWQEVVIKVAEAASGEHWGGVNDGQWHAPAKGFGLNIGKNPALPAEQQKGSIWFDDFCVVVAAPGKP